MTFTLGNVVRDALTELGQLNEGVATGGTTASLLDSGLGGADDDWNGGTVLVTRDADGAGAAPEGEFATVTDYTATGGAIATAANGFTVAPAAGDIYGVSTSYYPLRQIIRSVNRALMSLGDIPQVDISTLTTASGKTEYTASVAWKRRPPFRVDIQTNNDADDNAWLTLPDWEYVPATAGTSGKIVLGRQPSTGYLLRVWFADRHATVNACTDVVYEGFQPELVVWKSIYHMLVWQHGRSQGTDEAVAQMLNNAEQMIGRLEMLSPTWYPSPKARLMIVGDIGVETGSTSNRVGDSR